MSVKDIVRTPEYRDAFMRYLKSKGKPEPILDLVREAEEAELESWVRFGTLQIDCGWGGVDTAIFQANPPERADWPRDS